MISRKLNILIFILFLFDVNLIWLKFNSPLSLKNRNSHSPPFFHTQDVFLFILSFATCDYWRCFQDSGCIFLFFLYPRWSFTQQPSHCLDRFALLDKPYSRKVYGVPATSSLTAIFPMINEIVPRLAPQEFSLFLSLSLSSLFVSQLYAKLIICTLTTLYHESCTCSPQNCFPKILYSFLNLFFWNCFLN